MLTVQPKIRYADFSLDADFLQAYQTADPGWSGTGFDEVIFLRTYAKEKPDGGAESWFDCCKRVVEGMYGLQKAHCENQGLPWYDKKSQRSAQECFDLMFRRKWSPPGRGLAHMGTAAVTRIGGSVLNNCAMVSTADIDRDFTKPFTWTMMMLAHGVGVGFDTRGAGKVRIVRSLHTEEVTVDDSREGWCDAIERVLRSWIGKGPQPVFDYSQLRPKGATISSLGGTASGPEALENLVTKFNKTLSAYVGETLDSTGITVLMNVIGECVVSGGTRRSSQIAFSTPDDLAFRQLKDPAHPTTLDKFPEWMAEPDPEFQNGPPTWASNNTLFADGVTDFTDIAEQIAKNGEPGLCWLEHFKNFGRMKDSPNTADYGIVGTNPCMRAEAPVLTPEGIRTLGEVDVGDTIWSGNQWTKITKKWSTGIKPVFEYHTTAGVVECTENHRIVQNGVKIEIKDATSIDRALGDLAYVGPLDPVDVLDGLLIGDGSRNLGRRQKTDILLTVGERDQEYFESEVAPLIDPEPYRKPLAHPVSGNTVTALELPPMPVREIPQRFLRGDAKKMQGFLRGLYSANGSTVDARVCLKTTSPVLARQVQQMLSALGMMSYITTNKEHDVTFDNGTFTCKESYDVNTSYRSRFHQLIGFVHGYKTEKLAGYIDSRREGSKKQTFDITAVKPLGEHEVFDITVEADEHTYWSGGHLVSNCGEQGLWNFELCTLAELMPSNCDSKEEFFRAIKYAYLYGKTVTLVPTWSPDTNQVMMRNRRIGIGQMGVLDNIEKLGLQTHLKWCDEGYAHICEWDETYSNWLGVPKSIKKTTLKPSGTTSLVHNLRPGIHDSPSYSTHCVRTVRIHDTSPLLPVLEKAGYKIEQAVKEPGTKVVYFPMKYENRDAQQPAYTIWRQVDLVALMNAHWSDNAVSCTVAFDPETEADQIGPVLNAYAHRLKSISFLPRKDYASMGFHQLPFTACTEEQYEEMRSTLKPLDLSGIYVHEADDKFCEGGLCLVPPT